MTHTIEQLAIEVGTQLREREWKLATAESCTGGGLAYFITEIPGSSAWFERGLVVYSNTAKEELLGVNPITLSVFGAVSEQIAREMSEGVLQRSQGQVSVAITGIAGPSGGTPDKPVGTVWISFSGINRATKTVVDIFSGNRHEIRQQTLRVALEELLGFITAKK